MGKINDARKALLTKQLEVAVVEHVGTPAGEPGFDEGYYSVFVPGAVREYNYVKAESEAEAIAKTKTVLESKIDQLSEEPGPSVDVQPDNMNLKVKKTIKTEEATNG